MTLAARMDVLRRQAGASGNVPVASAAAAGKDYRDLSLPAGSAGVDALRNRVALLRSLMGQRQHLRDAANPSAQVTGSPSRDRTLPGIEVAPQVLLIENEDLAPLAHDAAIELRRVRSQAQQRRALRLDPGGEASVTGARMLAIDTETTGLAGGTGTRAFMIGVAELDPAGARLRVRQLLTTTLAGEHSMLRIFLSWLRDDHVLLSYNGRSYDRPLLSTRLRLARLPDPLPALAHMDLLHVTRRAYRGIWPNCRLATAERELLGVVRDDDLPGSEAPAAWLAYLRGGSSGALRRVLTHNDQDLRSLMGLLAHFARSDRVV